MLDAGGRLKYLFTSTKGLILMAVALIGIVTAIWGTLSGPLAEIGVKEISVKLLGMDLMEGEREGRLIMLYHSIAMAVIAILVYMITANLPMKKVYGAFINATVTAGYLISLPSGLGFAYFGHNWTLHGLFIFGLSLIFFAGVMLAVAIWPWNKEYYLKKDSPYAHTASGFDLERLAFWTMTMATLGSAMIGAWSGSHFGKGFQVFLSEDTIRLPIKSAFNLAIIGHLHIMLALMGIAITLVLGRWYDFKGFWHKLAMPTMTFGTIVLTLGAWSVIYTDAAHTIIYVGSFFAMLAGLFLVIDSMPKIMRERLQSQGIEKATFGQKLMALLHDPLKFGVLWQMIYMNFTVSGVGIFMAIRLDEIFRNWPHREERIELAGHWHILSAIIATLILFYFADRMGLKGKIRQWFGWIIIIGSDLAFAAITIFEMKRLFASEYMQQPIVNTTMLLADIGLGAVIVLLAAFLTWRLIDLFKSRGLWKREVAEEGFPVTTFLCSRDSTVAVESSPNEGVSQ